jgi:hypothetical protein
VAGVVGGEVLGFTQAWGAYWLGLAGGAEGARARTHFVGGVGDEAADGACAWAGQLFACRERLQQEVQFFLGQVGVFGAQAADLGGDGRGPLPRATAFGRGGAWCQRGEVAAFAAQLRPPGEQGAAADGERFLGSSRAVALPEAQDLQSALRAGGDHAPA